MLKHAAQLYDSYNIFNAITLFINITIAKVQAQYHTRRTKIMLKL